MADTIAGKFTMTLDDTKVFLIRKKDDGHHYKIFHDGREERIEPDELKAMQKE
jgi:hypothetical protein